MQQLPPQPTAMDPLCSLGLLDCKKNPILIGSSGATGMLDGASSEVPFGACAEHDTVELKPVAVERLLLLDWYGKARRAPKSAISLLGAMGLWSSMIRGASSLRPPHWVAAHPRLLLAGT